MWSILKGIKIVLNIFVLLILLTFIIMIFNPVQQQGRSGSGVSSTNIFKNLNPFSLSGNDVVYESNNTYSSNVKISAARQTVLDRAKAMTEVRWSPQYNLADKSCTFTFMKGKTYYGIPYSMDLYQTLTVSDFLSKIKGSRTLYGNDCSGFVSAAWGISRQTTLTLYNAVNSGSKVDGRTVTQISWDALKPGDALLLDNGRGRGHIMLFISFDSGDKNKLNVYEQNIPTIVPYVSMPTARKDIRMEDKLKAGGYIPIRISGLD